MERVVPTAGTGQELDFDHTDPVTAQDIYRLLGLVIGRQVRGVVEGDSVPQLLIPRLLELWRRGQLPVEKLVTTFAGTEVNEAMRAMENGHVVKPVVVFSED